jgi:aerobic C4-dicarboxylate transport protein
MDRLKAALDGNPMPLEVLPPLQPTLQPAE